MAPNVRRCGAVEQKALPEHTRGPQVTLDDDDRGALFPSTARKLGLAGRALASAMGWEGLEALAVYLACGLVLALGAVAVAVTWVSTQRLNGAVFWYGFAVAVGICGWFLSGQVTKRWLRTFVGVSVVIGAILLITIGRNAHIKAAKDEAGAEARSLLAAAASADVDAGDSAESALLAMLCQQGGLGTSGDQPSGGDDGAGENTCSIAGKGQIEAFDTGDTARSDARYGQQLQCLPGWTVGTFVEWTNEASRDRQVAALSALASCEIGVVNPAAEAAAQDEMGTTVTTAAGADSGAPAAGGESPGATSGGDATGPTEEATAAVRAALQVQRSEVTAQEAVSTGADELLTFASGRTDFEQIRFSVTAWLVLVAAALLWYRRLEIRASAHRLGPVDVQFEAPVAGAASDHGDAGATASTTKIEAEARPPRTRAEAVFKESVIRNVPEPGAIPGGEALAPVGDLVAQTDVPHRTLISGVIEAARTILATRGGFTVIFSVRPSDDGDEHVAFVRLRDTRTGNHLASHIVYDRSEEKAARRAGYWVAGWIISRSDYVPSWAQWNEDDASSFPPLPPAWSAGVQPTAQRCVRPEEFDPNAVNSLILAQRAYAYQTTLPKDPHDRKDPEDPRDSTDTGRRPRNHLSALEDIARAVHRSRRYPVAGYRRGAALSTMMFHGDTPSAAAGLPPGVSDEDRERRLPSPARLRYLLSDLLLRDRTTRSGDDGQHDVDGWIREIRAPHGSFPEDMRVEMLRLVAEWSNRNRAALRWSWVARLRPSERFFWHEFRRTGLARDWMLVSATELFMSNERLKFRLTLPSGPSGQPQLGEEAEPEDRDQRELEHLERRVRRRALEADSHWQIAYNLACLHAVRAHLWSRLGDRFGPDEPARHTAERRATACRAVALDWLERCLDRPASDQLVREWVDADGDLDPLRGDPQFAAWRQRVRAMGDAPAAARPDDGDRGRPPPPTTAPLPRVRPLGPGGVVER